MSRAEHTYTVGDLTVLLIVPDGVTAPRYVDVKRGGEVVRCRWSGVRNLRAPAKRKPSQAVPQTRMTATWEPTEAGIEWVAREAPSVNVALQTSLFVDWAISKGEARADWSASWRNWMKRTHAENVAKGWKPPRSAAPAGETPEQKWCREHGVTVDEYRDRKDDRAWVEMIKRRGKVA